LFGLKVIKLLVNTSFNGLSDFTEAAGVIEPTSSWLRGFRKPKVLQKMVSESYY
jgi:hypothetical protein